MKSFTTEITEPTEIFKRFFSVSSVYSVVKSFGMPTKLDTPSEFIAPPMGGIRVTLNK